MSEHRDAARPDPARPAPQPETQPGPQPGPQQGLSTPAPSREQTSWSPGLVAFYTGCGFVSLGAAVLFSGILVFSEYDFYVGVVVLGAVMIAGGSTAMWLGLTAARRE